MNLLVDTSIFIEFLRIKDKTKSILLNLLDNNSLFISILTHSELYSGKSVWNSKTALDELERLFSVVTIINLDKMISKEAGRLKALHNDSGLVDCIIAATAIKNDMQIVTLNFKDFDRLNEVKVFSIL